MTSATTELPLAEADGIYAERRNLLGLALLKANADLHECRLAVLIFEGTGGGKSGRFTRSYEELAARPWGLCCSRSKVRAAVLRLRTLGIVAAHESQDQRGSQDANAYELNWEGIRTLLCTPCQPIGSVGKGDLNAARGGASTEHGGARAHKEIILPDSGIPYSVPDPVPVPDPETGDCKGEPRPERGAARTADEPAELVRRELLELVPELREASGRWVDPLPSQGLSHGVYTRLCDKDVVATPRLVWWFRRQLSSLRPVCSGTEADLLLVLAAGITVEKTPARDLITNRVAMFVYLVSRGKWRRVVPYIPEARARLDALAELLTQVPASSQLANTST